MISRGHRLEDLKDGYTIGQVQLFCKALRLNRRREVLDQAVAVSLGIRDALGKDGKLIQGWLAAGDEPEPLRPPERRLQSETMAWFQQQPVARLKKG